MTRFYRILAAILLLLLAIVFCRGVASCKPPAPPAPTTAPSSQPAPPRAMIVVVPGLGTPQTWDIVARLQKTYGDRANIVDFGANGNNAYLGDVAKYIAENPHSKLIFVGHSYGVSKIFQVLQGLKEPVALVVDIDGIRESGQGPFILPASVGVCVVIVGDFVGLIREQVVGPTTELKIHDSHNDLPHDIRAMSIVESYVGESL